MPEAPHVCCHPILQQYDKKPMRQVIRTPGEDVFALIHFLSFFQSKIKFSIRPTFQLEIGTSEIKPYPGNRHQTYQLLVSGGYGSVRITESTRVDIVPAQHILAVRRKVKLPLGGANKWRKFIHQVSFFRLYSEYFLC